jgi:transposase
VGAAAAVAPHSCIRDRRAGQPDKHHRRAIRHALRYVTDNSIKRRALPSDFPPWQTVQGFFTCWGKAEVFNKIRDRLREKSGAPQANAQRCLWR